MKLTNKQTMKRKSGMTLLELTVVILVLLSLISVLFIGARAWKRGADRAACILNIRNVQNAVRSWANMNNKRETEAMTQAVIIGTGLFVEKAPTCPGGGTYDMSALATVPPIGTLAMKCSLGTGPEDHVPDNYEAW